MAVKVCFITNYAYSLFNPKSRIVAGGIETIFYIIAKDLTPDERFEVSFLLEDDVRKNQVTEKIDGITLYKTSRQIQPKIYQDKQIEKYHRWFIYWAGKFDRLWQWPHLDFFRLWEKLKQIQADIYIHASPNYESGLINLTVRLVGKKSFYMVANDEIYYWGIKSAGVIWCLSGRHRKIIKEKYHLEAINLPCWFPRPKTTLPFKKRNYLLWVGRIEPRKHPEAFIKLAKSLPNLKFLMIVAAAPNEPDLYKTIIKTAAKISNLQLKQDAMFTDLDRYYQTALAFIDTSGYKNLNMTQVQAAAFKIPGLTLFKDPNDSFRQYHWGISANGSFDRLIRNIKAILANQNIWQTFADNAFEFAEQVYNPKSNLMSFKKQMIRLMK